jgi:hypothetical protein
MPRPRPPLLAVLLAILAAAALVGLGRLTAPTAAARARGYHDGTVAGYADGFSAGRAQGFQEGQAVAETANLPSGSRDRARAAFDGGYRAGANAAFGGYDGGWSLGQPYVIVLAKGADGVTYRIAARAPCPRTSTTTPTSLLACQAGR